MEKGDNPNKFNSVVREIENLENITVAKKTELLRHLINFMNQIIFSVINGACSSLQM